jgi:hypothetical protein
MRVTAPSGHGLHPGYPGAADSPSNGAWRPCDPGGSRPRPQDRDRRELPGARQPSERHGRTLVRLDAVAWLLWGERRGNPPAAAGCLGEGAVEPVPTETGRIDAEQRLGLGLARADQGHEGTRPGVEGAPRQTAAAPRSSGGVGHGDGRFVHIQTHVAWVSVPPSGPPRSWFAVHVARHNAALARGTLTREVHRRSADLPGSHDV